MADSKVSALTAKTTLTGAEEVYINDDGTSKKATVTNLVAGGKAKWGTFIYTTSQGLPTTSFEVGFAARLSWLAYPSTAVRMPVPPTTSTEMKLRADVYANTLSAGGTHRLALLKNGTDEVVLDVADSDGTGVMTVTQTVSFADGDVISLRAERLSGTGAISAGGIKFGDES